MQISKQSYLNKSSQCAWRNEPAVVRCTVARIPGRIWPVNVRVLVRCWGLSCYRSVFTVGPFSVINDDIVSWRCILVIWDSWTLWRHRQTTHLISSLFVEIFFSTWWKWIRVSHRMLCSHIPLFNGSFLPSFPYATNTDNHVSIWFQEVFNSSL